MQSIKSAKSPYLLRISHYWLALLAPQSKAKSTLKAFQTLPIYLRRGIGGNKTKSASSSTLESIKTSFSGSSSSLSCSIGGIPSSSKSYKSIRQFSSRSRSESDSPGSTSLSIKVVKSTFGARYVKALF